MSTDHRAPRIISRSFRDWKPGIISSLVFLAAGLALLLIFGRYLPSPYLIEAIFVIFFLGYSAIFFGYAIARGHDETQSGKSLIADTVRAAIPYSGKSLAIWSLLFSFVAFFSVAALRTPMAIQTLTVYREKALAQVNKTDPLATRLEFVSEDYKTDTRAFWRKAILGIDTLHVIHEGERHVLLAPSGSTEALISAMRTGYTLVYQLGPGELATVDMHKHLYALESRPMLFISKVFLFTLMESLQLMAVWIYLISIPSLIAHRHEKLMRERLYSRLSEIDWSKTPKVALRPAGFWPRSKFLNPALYFAVTEKDPGNPYLVSYRPQNEMRGFLLDLLDPSFGSLSHLPSLLFPKSRSQVNPIHRMRLGYVVVPESMALAIEAQARNKAAS